MSHFLPMFPLELVVFPGESLRLHIFEPRYRQLIQDCEMQDLPFGITAFIQGRVAEYGTEVRLTEVTKRYDSGESDVIVEGVRCIHIERFIRQVPDKLYSGADTIALEESGRGATELDNQLVASYSRLHELLHTQEKVEKTGQALSFYMAHRSGLTLGQKTELLSITSEAQRQEFLLAHFQQVIPALEAIEETRQRLSANGRFHKLPKIDF